MGKVLCHACIIRMHSEGYSTWSVCVCVCVSITQHLTLNVIICATNDSNLPSGG